MHSEVKIECVPTGHNGTVRLTARLGDEVLAVEKLDISKSKSRDAFIDEMVKGRPALAVRKRDLRAELMKLAESLPVAAPGAPMHGAAELDMSRIVRPERFITDAVSGLAVATAVDAGGKIAGRWALYLRWADGRRHRIDLPTSIDTGDGARLYVHPTPSDPTTGTPAGWTAQSRSAWLAGSPAPDPAEVFRAICERFANYIDLPNDRAPGITATLAVWVMLTYVYPAWPAVPYLFIGGPAGSGKTRVFEILAELAFRPFRSSSATGPLLFRTLHNMGGVLLLDEAERLRQNTPDVEELCGALLAGYRRGGVATRLEPVGDGFRTVSFDLYGPKCFACIAGLPPALASRCIHLTMFRAAPGSQKPRRRIDTDAHRWQAIRDDLHALALEHGRDWLELSHRADVCPTMSGRDYELWQPLLALAGWIESKGLPGLLDVVKHHAADTIETSRDDSIPEADEVLLRCFREKLHESPEAKELLAAAKLAEPDLFGKWIAQGVGRVFKRYGLKTHKSNGRRVYRATLDDLRRIEVSYRIDLGLSESVPDVPAVPETPFD